MVLSTSVAWSVPFSGALATPATATSTSTSVESEPSTDPANDSTSNASSSPSPLAPSAGESELSDCKSLVRSNYVLRHQGDYQGAEKVLRKALAIAREDADKILVYNALGGLYMHTDDSVQAEKYLRLAVALGEKVMKPDSLDIASLLDNLSVVCSSGKKFEEAESLNTRAIEIYKKNSGSPNADVDLITVLGNRGFILSKQRKFAESQKSFEEAVLICKGSSFVPPSLYATMMDNLGSAYYSEGNLEKSESCRVDALALFESSLGLAHPETIKAKQNLAGIYIRQGRLEDAANLLKSAINGLKGTGSVNNNLLTACMFDYQVVQDLIAKKGGAGSGESAKSDAKSPQTPDEVSTSEGYVALERGNLDAAKKAFDRAISQNPSQAGAYAGRAKIFDKRGDRANQLKDLDSAIKNYPCAPYYFARGDWFLRKSDFKSAISDLKKCAEMDSKRRFKVVNFLIGACYVELNDGADAVPYLNKYLADDRNRNDPQGYAIRAAAYHSVGKDELANEDLKRAKELKGKIAPH